MNEIKAFPSFEFAAKSHLEFLQARYGFDLCMVTRKSGDEWLVLQAADSCYGVEPGHVFCWSDSICSRMVRTNGPRVVPRLADVPAYMEAPITKQVKVGAYLGIPLVRNDGSMFGTLCGMHPEALDPEIEKDAAVIEMLTRSLCTLLDYDLKMTDHLRRLDRASTQAMTDELTGLYNRRGWNELMQAEENRCSVYGHPAVAFSIDLDNLKEVNDHLGHAAGDELLQRAARTLQTTIRQQDFSARISGDEFALLITECSCEEAVEMKSRLEAALAEARVRASVGYGMRDPRHGLRHAWQRADEAMYTEKRIHKLPEQACAAGS
jgi:diguanylate cyclase